MGSSDEEYLDNLLKSISVGGTDSENDLDLLLSQLDQELDNQLQQQEGTAPVSDNMLDGLADFGMEEEMDAVTENELDGLADFGEEETENTLDGLADFGAESEGDDVPDDVSESEPDGIADFSMENDTDIDMENILDGLSDLSDEGENAEAAEEPLSFDSGMELDGLGDLFGEASGEETMELPEDDEDLAEINDLLRKSDNHELVDDDMYALLENMSEEDGGSTYQESESNDFDLFGMDYADGSIEISPEDMAELESIPEKPAKAQKEKKQKEKKVKEKKVKDKQAKGGLFAKKKSNDAEESAENVPEEGSKPETEKKKGLFGRFLDAITEEVDEEEDSKPKDENQAILDELDKEDAENGRKKKKKEKKEKKPKKEKPVKEKKVKEKKPKKVKEPKENDGAEKPGKEKGKKMSVGMILAPVLFAATLLAVLLIFVLLIPNIVNKQAAEKAFYNQEYEDVYYALSGEKLNENEQEMYEQTKMLMQLKRKVESYENYSAMGKEEEALNALIKGVQKYQELKPLVQDFGVAASFDETYTKMLDILSETYSMTEEEALELSAMEDAEGYLQKLQELTGNK